MSCPLGKWIHLSVCVLPGIFSCLVGSLHFSDSSGYTSGRTSRRICTKMQRKQMIPTYKLGINLHSLCIDYIQVNSIINTVICLWGEIASSTSKSCMQSPTWIMWYSDSSSSTYSAGIRSDRLHEETKTVPHIPQVFVNMQMIQVSTLLKCHRCSVRYVIFRITPATTPQLCVIFYQRNKKLWFHWSLRTWTNIHTHALAVC